MTVNNSTNKQIQNSEVKAYTVLESIASKQITMAYVMLAIGLVALLVIHFVGVLAIAALYLYVGYWQKDRKAITLFDKHIEFKAAPASSTKQIRYKDITNIEDISEKKVVIHSKDGSKARVPVALISGIDRKDLIKRLKEVID
ncbi:hypothetical protein OAT16_01815 [Prolixibacteraceae bacterium]|nr:hypothetical protein [Prolixibacteraceae bacterium]